MMPALLFPENQHAGDDILPFCMVDQEGKGHKHGKHKAGKSRWQTFFTGLAGFFSSADPWQDSFFSDLASINSWLVSSRTASRSSAC